MSIGAQATHWLGYIRDEICIPRGLPLLTSIVVNKQTRLPGTDWLPEGTEDLSLAEYRKRYEEQQARVFGYSGWDSLLQELGLPPLSMEAVRAADKILERVDVDRRRPLMSTMAILLATDDWGKMSIYQTFLATAPQAVWRTQRKYTPEYLADIPYPLSLYFFHKSIVGYRANCTGISRATDEDWHSLTPPEFRRDATPFTTFILIGRLERVADTHVSSFPKWDKPEERFQRGQLGLLRVRDVLLER